MIDIKAINSAKRQFPTVWFLQEREMETLHFVLVSESHKKTWTFHLHTYRLLKMSAAPQLSACTTGVTGSSVWWELQPRYSQNVFYNTSLEGRVQKISIQFCEMRAHQSSNTEGAEVHLLRTTQLRIQTLEASRQGALHGVLWVGQEVAVEGPAEGEEIQGLAALLLSRGADRATGLEDATLWAALGQKHSTHQPAQGLEARQLHQHLDAKMEKRGVCKVQHLAGFSLTSGPTASRK